MKEKAGGGRWGNKAQYIAALSEHLHNLIIIVTKVRPGVRQFQRVTTVLFILSIAICFIDPALAHAAFTSSLNSVDNVSSNLGTKTPLILIHGIHGKEDGAAYWQNFVSFFNGNDSLANKYKLYKFEYDSDQISVHDIAAYLADAVGDHSEFADKKIVIVAHSMGGLVARAYMQVHGGAAKIIKLITLATPHHGSPGANDEDALGPFYTSTAWNSVFSVSQFFYNISSGTLSNTLHSDQPNRSDLRWDSKLAPALSLDSNTWLPSLNGSLTSSQEQQIIAYYGYIDPNRQDRVYWEDPAIIWFWMPSIISYGPHTKLTIASAVMDAGLSEYFPLNDGMVPSQSGSLADHASVTKREFFDYDHLDMKDDKGSNELFKQLKDDLLALPSGDGYPSVPGSVYYGEIYPIGDVDRYPFTVTTTGKYVIYTRGATDTYGVLYNGSYGLLTETNYAGELDNFRIEYNITSPGTYYVEVKPGNSNVTGSYTLHIDGPGAGSTADRDDHGFSAWNATPVAVGSVTPGALDLIGDRDFFAFTAATTGKYVIYTRGATDTYGVLYNRSYGLLTETNYAGELDNFRIEYNITSPGTYYVEVKPGNSNVTGSYDLYIKGPPPPGTIALGSSSYSVNENGGTVTITATRTGGSAGAVGISYGISNGSALVGSDYTEASGTLSWANGDTANKTFAVSIINDALNEPNETFTVKLSSPTGGATLGSPNSATVTITNDDPPNAPVVNGVTPTNKTKPSWAWTSGGGGGNDIYQCNLDSGSWFACASPYASVSALAEGAHTLNVQERDDAGEWSDSGSRTVVVDITNPVLTISTLSDNAWTNNVTLNISGQATDENGVSTVTVNGDGVTLNPDGTFSYALTLAIGSNPITTIATDNADNMTTDTRTINFDPNAPVLTITAPADNSVTKVGTLPFTGTVDETATVTAKLNSYAPVNVPLTGNNFNMTVDLDYGLNTIELTAKDRALNTTTAKRTVTHDDQNPSLAITEPNADITTNQPHLLIKGTVTDLTIVTITVTVGVTVHHPIVTAGKFEQAIDLPHERINSVVVTATDAVGNTVTAQRNIIYIAVGDPDGNGTMNIVDALFVARHAAGLSVGTFYEEGADVNCDGVVNIVDALFIARKAAGLSVTGWCGQ